MATIVSNIVPFPAQVVADQKIREAERMIAKLLGHIEEAARHPANREAQIRAAIAPPMLDAWREILDEAKVRRELLAAGDALRFGGMTYRAQPSQNGAH
jgi:hypothetical protein